VTDLVFMVPAKEWTVEEFDRQMRGFRAKLVAFGDVFTERQPEKQPEQKPAKGMRVSSVDAMEADGCDWRGANFRAEVIRQVLKLKPMQTILIESSVPHAAQKQVLNSLNYFRKMTEQHVYVRTSVITKGDKRGVQVRRVA
jgi:hypothetical protein